MTHEETISDTDILSLDITERNSSVLDNLPMPVYKSGQVYWVPIRMPLAGEDDYGGGIPEQPIPSSAAQTIIAYRVGVVEKTLKDFVNGFDEKLEKLGDSYMYKDVLLLELNKRDVALADLQRSLKQKEDTLWNKIREMEADDNAKDARKFSFQTIVFTAALALATGLIIALASTYFTR